MPKKSERRLIGLTGTNASGKGEIARLLQARGYVYRSLSDILREEAKARGLPPSREVLIALGRELRATEGPATLALRTVAGLDARDYVIDSVRSPEEIRVLRKTGRFILLGVDAPIELRFERAKARGRAENATTVEEFRRLEELEDSRFSDAQQIDLALKGADRLFINDSTLEALESRVVAFLTSRSFL